MLKSQKVLLELLEQVDHLFSKKDQPKYSSEAHSKLAILTPVELSRVYVDIGYLKSFLVFLLEQIWMDSKKEHLYDRDKEKFFSHFLKNEFSERAYLHEFLKLSSKEKIKNLIEMSNILELVLIGHLRLQSNFFQKDFLVTALPPISELFEFENLLQIERYKKGETLDISLYRTFDSLDEIFNLNYQADLGMKVDLLSCERLYEGAGVGVQSGYSTVFTAIRYLNPLPHSRFIDLGSGYGRLGLIIGLVRPDIDFIGYEFVEHRVDIAYAATKRYELQDHVHFHTQDLSQKSFIIPDAEIYYLYDPFSEETYNHVLSQLVEISQRQKISIATKGNARHWLNAITTKEGWPPAQMFDQGNLCLYNSR